MEGTYPTFLVVLSDGRNVNSIVLGSIPQERGSLITRERIFQNTPCVQRCQQRVAVPVVVSAWTVWVLIKFYQTHNLESMKNLQGIRTNRRNPPVMMLTE
jgi:hypothetical protein